MRRLSALIAVATVAGCESPGPAGICERPLGDQVDVAQLVGHLEALQAIADANQATRAAGTPGYDASSAYVVSTLEDAGYLVDLEEFEFERFVEHSPATLEQTSPTPIPYAIGVDFATAPFSGSGEVMAGLSPVDLDLGLDNASTSGCEATDFDGFAAGTVALIQRGECPFALKAANAEAAGAAAVLIFNQGDTPDRRDLFPGTLGPGSQIGLPVLFTSYAWGETFAEALDDPSMHVRVDAERTTELTHNVLAETPEGDEANVVMLGAHLDSVPAGPGINDNGSGSAIVLQIAQRMIDCTPQNRVRFAWWGAEELGLIGSTEHVDRLSDAEIATVAVYLNFDMVASPNFTHFVYDGDGSSFEYDTPAPVGSAAIEGLLREHFGGLGIDAHDAALNGRSDYWGFMNRGVAVGGTFTGAEGAKTSDEATQFGGAADSAYDDCYHAACDTIDNVAVDALEQNAVAAASTTERLAADLSPIGR